MCHYRGIAWDQSQRVVGVLLMLIYYWNVYENRYHRADDGYFRHELCCVVKDKQLAPAVCGGHCDGQRPT